METGQIVPKDTVKKFIERIMIKIGVNPTHAENLADVLVTGDYRGHYSHGLNRLDYYIVDIEKKVCEKDGVPVVLKESAATAWVDGKNLLGPVVGKFCMKLAIEKAQQSGIGWVVCKGSNHFGIAGYYSMMALEHKLLGMSFTNASPLTSVTRGKKPFFGTNPISLSAPTTNQDKNFVLDMATSVVALGKIEIASRRGEKIQEGWAVDKNGRNISNPNDYHALLPLGGSEISGGYKGYGMAALVEIFCAVLSGSQVAPNVRGWTSKSGIANLGQCFIAINPDCFAPGFEQRMETLVDNLKSQEPAEPIKPILVHGDPERANMQKCDQNGGIEYHINQIKMANELAKRYGVEPLI